MAHVVAWTLSCNLRTTLWGPRLETRTFACRGLKAVRLPPMVLTGKLVRWFFEVMFAATTSRYYTGTPFLRTVYSVFRLALIPLLPLPHTNSSL